MAWYKLHMESCTRGYAYVEAEDEATAILLAEGAPLEVAIQNQTLHEAIQEKIAFKVLSVEEQIEGVDYIQT